MSPNTNAIGTGTRNTAINAPVDFLRDLGQWVTRHNLTMGEFLRRAAVDEVAKEDPAAAEQLKARLKAYYGPAVFMQITRLEFLTATATMAAGENPADLRRSSTHCRVIRVTKGNRNEGSDR